MWCESRAAKQMGRCAICISIDEMRKAEIHADANGWRKVFRQGRTKL